MPSAVIDKRLSTLSARAALLGACVLRSTDDRDRPLYVVNAWAATERCESIDEAEAFVEQLERYCHGAHPSA